MIVQRPDAQLSSSDWNSANDLLGLHYKDSISVTVDTEIVEILANVPLPVFDTPVGSSVLIFETRFNISWHIIIQVGLNL